MTEQRLVFGTVAELYDDMRAGYPPALFDDLLDYAQLRPGSVVLEVGAGTGIATRALLARGLAVHVVEPSADMAEVLRARTAGSAVSVEVCGFEDWRPQRPYRLVVAAQSWHWVDPAVGYARAREALAEGGTIAIFGHRPHTGKRLRERIDAVYAAHPLGEGKPRPYHADEAYGPEVAAALEASAGFTDVEHRVYLFSLTYSTPDYLRLMTTMSDHLTRHEARRAALHADLAAVVDEAGGCIEIDYRTDLYLARTR